MGPVAWRLAYTLDRVCDVIIEATYSTPLSEAKLFLSGMASMGPVAWRLAYTFNRVRDVIIGASYSRSLSEAK